MRARCSRAASLRSRALVSRFCRSGGNPRTPQPPARTSAGILPPPPLRPPLHLYPGRCFCRGPPPPIRDRAPPATPTPHAPPAPPTPPHTPPPPRPPPTPP